MKKISLLFVCLMSLAFLNATGQQQLPERKPYFKSHPQGVAAAMTSAFVVDSIGVADLVNALLGPGAVISNLVYTGSPLALGSFSDPLSSLGLDSGVVISTGKTMDIPGPNVSASTTTLLNTPGDSLLGSLVAWPTFDAAIIEFDVLVQTDTLACHFVLGSEEYPEFSPSNFNDVFAFFVSGPGLPGTINIARIPGTNDIISINNINPTTNPQYYVDNTNGQELEYDGFTVPFLCQYPVQNGQTYHFRLALADCADPNFDSGIFLKKNSVLGYASMPVPSFNATVNGMTVQFTNTTNYAIFYVWDFGDGVVDTTVSMTVNHTYATAGVYNVVMEAHNYYQVASCTQTLSLGNVGLQENITAIPEARLIKGNNGRITIDLGIPVQAVVRVFDITGQEKMTMEHRGSSLIKVNLDQLPRGLYILRLNTPAYGRSWKILN
ncbi:MAG TPA: choice-of-anchor L domain-containing protein [Bacteroidales bacterium]|nr:choice-of-anchor L domain-containing protein [Bacteroidales bacterium]HSA43126.1 choice-of-anchor L domain-containing protein [Bacteroidales bacterium]